MFDALLSDRLAEMTFKPVAETALWLRRLGLEVDTQPDGMVRVRNPHLNLTTAITDSTDPVARAVSLAMACFGPWWPRVTPGLLKAVDKAWQEERHRKLKEAQQEES